ncbi:hypothetical protein TWF281_002491 [Arthrobotrys megalospora]
MARYISTLIITLLSLHFATAAILVERQRVSPTSTYTYTKDTIVKPTAHARFQVGVPINVVWYIPETRFNQNTAESFNITIALGGKVAMELSNSVSFPGYGEHDTTFTPTETWPQSNKYQIFIFMDFGTKTLTSPNFGIWGGGKTPTPTPDDEETSSTTTSQASRTSPPSTTTSGSEASTTSSSGSITSETTDPSPSTSTEPAPSGGVSGTILGGAIGGSIVGTLAIVGLIWFMRKSMADSRASHGSNGPNNSNTNNGNHPPPSYQNNNGNGNQQWPYQQMNAQSTTSVNQINSEYKGFAPPPPPPPPVPAVNEMPTQMHHEPVELYSMPQQNTAAEMPGDMSWNMPPPPPLAQQQQPQRYVYGPQSYDR